MDSQDEILSITKEKCFCGQVLKWSFATGRNECSTCEAVIKKRRRDVRSKQDAVRLEYQQGTQLQQMVELLDEAIELYEGRSPCCAGRSLLDVVNAMELNYICSFPDTFKEKKKLICDKIKEINNFQCNKKS